MAMGRDTVYQILYSVFSATFLLSGTVVCNHTLQPLTNKLVSAVQTSKYSKVLTVVDLQSQTLTTESTTSASTTEGTVDYNEPLVSKMMLSHANTPSRCWIAYKGYVYDVTNHPMWKGCKHNGVTGGIDITNFIPHPPTYVYNLPLVGRLVDRLPPHYKKQMGKLAPIPMHRKLPLYSWQEIFKHRSAKSCWVVVDGYVYDVTGFINNHPGGWEIIEGCGRDLSNLFRYGIHFREGRKYLDTFKIGKVDPNSKPPYYIRWYDD